MATVHHKDLTGADLHVPKAHASSHVGGSDPIANASGATAGLMSATDKSSLDSLVTNGTTKIQESSGPTTLTAGAWSPGQVLKRVGSTMVGVFAALALLVCGDGSDGNVTISSGTTTLARVQFYQNLTITGGTLDLSTAGACVAGTYDATAAPTGAIKALATLGAGGNGSGATGGGATVPGTAKFVGIGSVGTAGTTATTGAGTTATIVSQINGAGGAGGASGAGGTANSGGTAGGASGVGTAANATYLTQWVALSGLSRGTALIQGGVGGRGGSSGAGDGTNVGGGGGGGGPGAPVAWFVCNTFARGGSTGASMFQAVGAAGGNGGNAVTGNGGGGSGAGGGGGGWIYFGYFQLSGSAATNCFDASGGQGGTGGNGVGTGKGGQGGTGGGGGMIFIFDLANGTLTPTPGSAGSAGAAVTTTAGTTGGAGGACLASL